MPGEFVVTFADFGNERSITRLPIATITAANHDAVASGVTTLLNAIQGIQEPSVPTPRYFYGNATVVDTEGSPTPGAQRERKWMVRWSDDSNGKKYRTEIACADLTHLDINNKGFADMDDAGDVAAFVTAFEAVVVSPDGNPVSVNSIEHVGRNT